MSYAAIPPWLLARRMMAGGSRWQGWGGHGPGGPWGPRGFYRGGPKAARGDVRLAILHLLSETPMHGYQIMQELSERTKGMWQPSPGAVYPTLQQLEDEGLVRPDEQEGKKVYTLTDAGREALGDADTPPWERFEESVDDRWVALREAGFGLGAAVMQVTRAGSSAQVRRTREILDEARRQIYQLLAEAESDD